MTQTKQSTALVAISGGLDSICLAHSLLLGLSRPRNFKPTEPPSNVLDPLVADFIQQQSINKVELAYIDHSQRADTNFDIKAVRTISDKYSTTIHISKIDLPKDCSEEQARNLRYLELKRIRLDRGLDYLITAHHADDVIETAIINLSRGTGPKGLSSLRHHKNGTWRPFLINFTQGTFITKEDLEEYAQEHQLSWHEDSTNNSYLYLRNRIRHRLKEQISAPQKQAILKILAKAEQTNQELEEQTKLTLKTLSLKGNTYKRLLFMELDMDVKRHIIHSLISDNGYDVNRQAVQRAVDFIETAATKKTLQLKGCDVYI